MLSFKLLTTSRCSFSFYSYCSLSPPPPSPYPEPYDVKGFVKVWLGNDSCVKSQLIYQSGILDEVWFKNVVPFTPNDNYQFIYFEAEKGEDIPNAVMSYIFIDAISPITVNITSKAKIEVSKVSENCFNLQNNIDADVQAVRYEWKNKWGVLSNQTSIENICIDKPTTIYFTAYDACGYSYTDSIILVKNNIVSALNENETELNVKIVKQPINSELALYNTLGQLMYKQTIEAGISSIQIPIDNWSKGVYFTTLQNLQIKEVNKWMKKL